VAERKRERSKPDPQARKQAILSAAVRVFAETGYRNTEVQRIAEAAGIAKGTVYLYFNTKQDVFMAAVTYAVDRLAERTDAEVQNAVGPVEKIRAVVRAYLGFFDEDRALVKILAQERGEVGQAEEACYRMFAKNARHLEEILREGITQGLFRPLEPKQAARILANLLTGTVYAHVLDGRDGRASSAAEAVTDFLLYGILEQEIKT